MFFKVWIGGRVPAQRGKGCLSRKAGNAAVKNVYSIYFEKSDKGKILYWLYYKFGQKVERAQFRNDKIYKGL